jgi:DNA-binding CsgD family transcriptional regulator
MLNRDLRQQELASRIAQTLFVTIKTVEVHLSHAYRKLEISSRAQLQNALLTPAPNSASASA